RCDRLPARARQRRILRSPPRRDPVPRPARPRPGHRRVHRLRDLLAADAGPRARPPPRPARPVRHQRVRQPGRLGLAAPRGLPQRGRPQPGRTGHPGPHRAFDHPGRAADVGRAVRDLAGGGMSGAQWWLAPLGRTVVWARLRVLEAGTAEVFDSDGNTLPYDSEDTARAALLDAEFVEFDGLDEEDALARGFSLAEIVPPQAGSDEALRALMFTSLGKAT